MTKLRYVGTYAQEFPGPDDTRITLAPGEYVEDADTENEEVKAAMERGELIDPADKEAPEGFVVEDNVPDGEAPALQQEQPPAADTSA